ncbi:MAG: tRNA (adenosine(37)-N6)-threonylcarbamoyltransferase complex transferase subunit TsaD [Phycisphaerales bacterium]|nr:tRNA (adenosine(37)-N6)-threonylcarbamoyltransferase complex transferase subunit TsaD [Phycisphaerales bacterium]
MTITSPTSRENAHRAANTGHLILGLETSCDETAAAVVRTDPSGRAAILSNTIASQHELHAEYRGVVPEIASRAHAERLLPIVRQAVKEAGVTLADLDAVAVGNRPGLIGSLLVGVAGAKGLALALGKPCIPVDHIHAHLYAGCMTASPMPLFPSLGLVVSGGHTSIYLMHSPARMTRIAATIDDAIGEAYDKVAAIIGPPLGFPGGPQVDALAQKGDPSRITFPISRVAPGSLDFSFSGLKTAVLYKWNGVPGPKAPKHERPTAEDLCASFQHAAVAAITMKLGRAIEQHAGIRSLLVGGGVSANSRLRAELTRLANDNTLDLRLPPMDLCMDNAAMIAGLAAVLINADPTAGSDSGFSAVPTTSQ